MNINVLSLSPICSVQKKDKPHEKKAQGITRLGLTVGFGRRCCRANMYFCLWEYGGSGRDDGFPSEFINRPIPIPAHGIKIDIS